MEQRKINLSIIFATIIFVIGVAFRSLSNFFGGVGIPFVACLVLSGLTLTFGMTKKENARHLIDIFVMLLIVVILQLIMFMGYEWALTITRGVVKFRIVCSNILSVISLIFLIYTFIRLMFELSNKKFVVTEAILGLRHKTHSEKMVLKKNEKKTPKEIKNGDFSEKPSELENLGKDDLEDKENDKNEEQDTTISNEF